MATWIAGTLAVLSAIVFLGWLTVSINATPLWIVMVLSAALMIADFVGEMRSGENSDTRR